MRRQRLSGCARRKVESPVINLTPLIDVVFVILIMFIVIAPLLEVEKVQLAAAGAAAEHTLPASETSSITIHVKEDNTVYLNGTLIALDLIYPRLKEEKEKHPDATPQLFHDTKGHFGVYQQIKNSVEQAGFEELDLILLPAGKAGAS